MHPDRARGFKVRIPPCEAAFLASIDRFFLRSRGPRIFAKRPRSFVRSLAWHWLTARPGECSPGELVKWRNEAINAEQMPWTGGDSGG
jgi:hypothetical protein